MSPAGRTTLEVAAKIGRPVGYAQALLEDERRRGLVEQVDGRWRLTASAEAWLGPALREIAPPEGR
jgi:hypothetical protein